MMQSSTAWDNLTALQSKKLFFVGVLGDKLFARSTRLYERAEKNLCAIIIYGKGSFVHCIVSIRTFLLISLNAF